MRYRQVSRECWETRLATPQTIKLVWLLRSAIIVEIDDAINQNITANFAMISQKEAADYVFHSDLDGKQLIFTNLNEHCICRA